MSQWIAVGSQQVEASDDVGGNFLRCKTYRSVDLASQYFYC